MEFIITFLISTLAQTIMSAYFVFCMSKIFENKNYTKIQTIKSFIVFAIIGPFSQILKNYFPSIFPLLNIPFTILMLFVITHFI